MPDDTPAHALGRRSAPRAPSALSFEAVLLNTPDRATIRIHATDNAPTGLGFHSRRLFRLEERLALKLRFVNAPGQLILCRTRHCRTLAPGVYHVGIEFLETLSLPTGPCPIPDRWLTSATPPTPPLPAPLTPAAAAETPPETRADSAASDRR